MSFDDPNARKNAQHGQCRTEKTERPPVLPSFRVPVDPRLHELRQLAEEFESFRKSAEAQINDLKNQIDAERRRRKYPPPAPREAPLPGRSGPDVPNLVGVDVISQFIGEEAFAAPRLKPEGFASLTDWRPEQSSGPMAPGYEPSAPYTQGEPSAPYTQGEPSAPYTQGEPSAPYTQGEPSAPYTQGAPSTPYTANPETSPALLGPSRSSSPLQKEASNAAIAAAASLSEGPTTLAGPTTSTFEAAATFSDATLRAAAGLPAPTSGISGTCRSCKSPILIGSAASSGAYDCPNCAAVKVGARTEYQPPPACFTRAVRRVVRDYKSGIRSRSAAISALSTFKITSPADVAYCLSGAPLRVR